MWDARKGARPVELLQIVLIVAITARHGFLWGFGAGILIACLTFVVTYSRIPITDLTTHLGLLRSSVVRSHAQEEVLSAKGQMTPVYRLTGYVFFGSAAKIDAMFKARLAGNAEAVILDLSRVSGIDTSALGVFERILRRHTDSQVLFHLVYGPSCKAQLLALTHSPGVGVNLVFHESLDRALESAEEMLIERYSPNLFERTTVMAAEELVERSPFEEYLVTREIAAEEALFREGDQSDEVYFVESGRFDVLKGVEADGMPVRLAKVRHGAIVGELAFYSGEPRSATIIATTQASVRVMHRHALERMRQENPALATRFDHMVIRSVAGNLKRTTQMVTTLT